MEVGSEHGGRCWKVCLILWALPLGMAGVFGFVRCWQISLMTCSRFLIFRIFLIVSLAWKKLSLVFSLQVMLLFQQSSLVMVVVIANVMFSIDVVHVTLLVYSWTYVHRVWTDTWCVLVYAMRPVPRSSSCFCELFDTVRFKLSLSIRSS